MKQRLKMTFDGWAAQYENIPSWRPKIKENDTGVFLDEHCVCKDDEKIVSISIKEQVISIYLENNVTGKERKILVCIEWPHAKEPYIKEILK